MEFDPRQVAATTIADESNVTYRNGGFPVTPVKAGHQFDIEKVMRTDFETRTITWDMKNHNRMAMEDATG
jgi:hypothetical protein